MIDGAAVPGAQLALQAASLLARALTNLNLAEIAWSLPGDLRFSRASFRECPGGDLQEEAPGEVDVLVLPPEVVSVEPLPEDGSVVPGGGTGSVGGVGTGAGVGAGVSGPAAGGSGVGVGVGWVGCVGCVSEAPPVVVGSSPVAPDLISGLLKFRVSGLVWAPAAIATMP